jgi:ketosteroid isomerase-like protein
MRAVEPNEAVSRVVRRGYAAFNARDVEGALAVMTTDVQWANGWEGGHVHGKEAVRDYWTGQWQEFDSHVTPTHMSIDGDGVVVLVDQIVRRPDGTEVRAGTVRHRFELRDGLISRMDILPDVPPSI